LISVNIEGVILDENRCLFSPAQISVVITVAPAMCQSHIL
jgi:hypothetical protein